MHSIQGLFRTEQIGQVVYSLLQLGDSSNVGLADDRGEVARATYADLLRVRFRGTAAGVVHSFPRRWHLSGVSLVSSLCSLSWMKYLWHMVLLGGPPGVNGMHFALIWTQCRQAR